MSTKQDADNYLERVRALVANSCVLFVPRDKNIEGLAALQLTQAAALGIIRTLTHTDYCRGPQEDRDRPGQECWIFGVAVGPQAAYIKLVIESLPRGRERLKVLSFHPADFPLTFPLV